MEKVYDVEEVSQTQNCRYYSTSFYSEGVQSDNWYIQSQAQCIQKLGVINSFTMFSRDEINRPNPVHDMYSQFNIPSAEFELDYHLKQTTGGFKTANTYNNEVSCGYRQINKQSGFCNYVNGQNILKSEQNSCYEYCLEENLESDKQNINEDPQIIDFICCKSKIIEQVNAGKPLFNIRPRKFLNIEINKTLEGKYLKTSYGRKDDTVRLQTNFKNINLRILNLLKQQNKIDKDGLELIHDYEKSKQKGFDITQKLFGIVCEPGETERNIVKLRKNADILRKEIHKKYSSSELVREVFKLKVALKLKVIILNYIQVIQASVVKPESHIKWKKLSD